MIIYLNSFTLPPYSSEADSCRMQTFSATWLSLFFYRKIYSKACHLKHFLYICKVVSATRHIEEAFSFELVRPPSSQIAAVPPFLCPMQATPYAIFIHSILIMLFLQISHILLFQFTNIYYLCDTKVKSH